MFHWTRTLVIGLLVTTLAAPAAASDRQKALQLYEVGKAHFLLKQYDKALEQFLKAYAYAQEPVLVQNLARCYEEKGNGAEAIKFFEKFLGTSLARKNRSLRQDTQKRLKRLRAQLAKMGTLHFEGGESGTAVSVDGRLVGRTPVQPVTVPPGRHTLLLAPQGRAAREHSVDVASGQAMVVDLSALFPKVTTARLRILGALATDQLTIDDAKRGPVPLGPIVLSTGEHRIVVERKGFPPFSASVKLPSGADHTLSVAFQALATGGSGPGPWPWIVGGVGLATAAAGIGFTVKANSEHDAAVEFAKDEDRTAEKESAIAARDQNDAIAYAMYGVGGALVITGVVLYFVLDDSGSAKKASTRATPWVVPHVGGASVGATISF